MNYSDIKEIYKNLDEYGARGRPQNGVEEGAGNGRLEPVIRKRVYRDAQSQGEISMLLAPEPIDGDDCRVVLQVATLGGRMTRVPLGRQQILNLITKLVEALQ